MTIARDPLDGIDDVPWHQLHHAYGPATDVPEQLRALRSDDVDERQSAIATLFGNVYHQGTRWQASKAVVPFLVAMVDDIATPDRGEIVRLLGAVAIGDRRDNDLPFDADAVLAARISITEEGMARLIHRLYEEEDALDDDEGFALSEAADALWTFDAYAAAAERLDTIAGWIHDADPEVAARAAALVAWFPPETRSLEALLSVSADRPHETVRASANLALAHLPTADGRVNDRLHRMLTPADGIIAVTAAVAMAYRMDEAIPDEALSVLVAAANRYLPPGVTGWGRAPRGFVALALQRLGLG